MIGTLAALYTVLKHGSVTGLTRECVEFKCILFCLDTQGWGVSPRGAGYLFGSDVVTQVQYKQIIICLYHCIVSLPVIRM